MFFFAKQGEKSLRDSALDKNLSDLLALMGDYQARYDKLYQNRNKVIRRTA